MGKGGKLAGGESSFTWEEVRQHTSRTDKWIVVDGEVYDITNWARKHPGGSRVISHYAGQDASVSLLSFYSDSITDDKSVLDPLQWCHNEHDCVSNHQHLDCLLNR